jgi:DNA-binding SARP family transcriptional activator
VLALIKKSALDIHLIDACFFGVPRFNIDDCEVQDSTWKTAKAKKLFSYLIVHKNEKVSQDVLIDALWEDATATSGKDNLRKALQYCRAAIKSTIMSNSDFIVSSKGSFHIAPNISIIVDTEEFEDSVAQARTMKQRGENFEHHSKRALTLYKRGFAEGWYEAWVEELRNHYKKLYEECCAMLAELYVDTNRLKEALDIYKKLLSIDFYNEMYHRQVMKLYSKLGLHKEIAVLFEQLQKALSKEFGTKPQQETVALYKSLIK